MTQQDHRCATILQPTTQTSPGRKFGLLFTRTGLAITRVLTGYGYRPARALRGLILLLLATAALVLTAAHTHDNAGKP